MGPGDEPATGLAPETIDQISIVLLVISEIASGDYTARVDVDGWTPTPIEALARKVNQLAEALHHAGREAERARQELEDKIRIVAAQRAAIDELSCPLIEVWESVLCVPIVGGMDASRGARMAEDLLHAVVQRRARYVIVDVTGIDEMDAEIVDHFQRVVGAVRLLGAACAISGIHPAAAQTMVHLGVELGDVRTHRTLESALREWVARSGRAARRPS